MTDSELLKAYRNDGDLCALTKLVGRYERLVWSVCQRSLQQNADVEDAFQTTFAILIEKANRIRRPGSLGNWLYGVARRTAAEIRRRQARNGCLESTELLESKCQLESIARQQVIDNVDHHIQTMSESHRTPIVLKYFGGFSASEIANQLNLSVSAVEGRLRRAKDRLRQKIQTASGSSDEVSLDRSLACCFVACSDRVALVPSSSATMISGTVSGFSYTLNMGTKIMVFKTLFKIGIAAMLLVATCFHSFVPANSTSNDTLVAELDPENSDSSATILIEENDESLAVDLHRLVYEHVKQVHRLHEGIAQHMYELADWLHQ